MNIAILVYAKPEVGLGHWYRSLALYDAAEKRDHAAWIVGNRMPLGKRFFQVREGDSDDLYHTLHQIKPDYLVVDLQDEVPNYVYDIAGNSKIVVLNGVGREEEEKADIAIVQGYTDVVRKNTYSGAEYVILRQGIINIPEERGSGTNWFVWGGARDKMGLLQSFSNAMPDEEAILSLSDFIDTKPELNGNNNHIIFRGQDDAIIPVMYSAGKACIATGMAAWELAAMRVPTYAFSWSEGHLRFAKRMEENGLIRAWNGVGLPSTEEIREFLKEPFIPNGTPPDGRGADRILNIMERMKDGSKNQN